MPTVAFTFEAPKRDMAVLEKKTLIFSRKLVQQDPASSRLASCQPRVVEERFYVGMSCIA